MAKLIQNEFEPDYVPIPGETLRETLDALDMGQAELARRTGRPTKTINAILHGNASITPRTALDLELATGVPARLWNALQGGYDIWKEKQQEAVRMSEDAEFTKQFPIKEMMKYNLIPAEQDAAELLRSLLGFFGVADRRAWEHCQERMAVSYRRAEHESTDDYALAVWLRKGVIDAQQLSCRAFDKQAFRKALDGIRSLTTEPPSVFQPELVKRCAECGVALTFVPALKNTRVSGAMRWLSKEKALIQLSLRYKADDQFWFSFFHEAAHAMQEHKRSIVIEIEGDTLESDDEVKANKFAQSILIPPRDFARIMTPPRPSAARIRLFARDIGIAPGIVVGQLQHAGRIPWSWHKDLKRTFEWVS